MAEAKRKGIIKPNGVILQAHELATVIFFTELGYDIELIPRSQTEGVHKPDIIMDGLEWEMKAPKGDGKWAISNIIKKAERQSENLIIDLRRSKLPQERSISLLTREFEHSKRLRRMKIITKSRNILDFRK